jgi:membrane associated rhomboid family serine protease
MFLPVGDTPRPQRYVPYITWALIAINVAVFALLTLPLETRPVDPSDPALRDYIEVIAPLYGPGLSIRDLHHIVANLSAYDLFVFEHGYKPGAPEVGDLFASLFLHGGLLHLAGNMLFLWIFGTNVEHRLGRLGFLVAYLLTGVLATVSFGLLAGPSMRPLVGASGAISGVLGVYFLLFPRNKVKVFIFLFPFLFDVFLLPARLVLGIFVIVDNLLPLLIGSESGVAYGAHLGGFVGGLVLAFVGDRLGWAVRSKDRQLLDTSSAVESRPPPASSWLEGLRASIRAGDAQSALDTLPHLAPGELDELSPSDCAQLAEWIDRTGYPVTAHRLLRRRLAGRHLTPAQAARLHLALGRINLRHGQGAVAYQHLLRAAALDPDSPTDRAARQALAAVNVYRRRG